MMKSFSAPPEAIILTMPVAFFKDRNMPEDKFADYFERYMRHETATWNFVKKQLPTQDVAWVYLVWSGKIQFRLNLVCYERNQSKSFDDSWDGKVRHFPEKNWIILSGPAVRPPHDIYIKGFQGHRYTEKLF